MGTRIPKYLRMSAWGTLVLGVAAGSTNAQPISTAPPQLPLPIQPTTVPQGDEDVIVGSSEVVVTEFTTLYDEHRLFVIRELELNRVTIPNAGH